MSWLKENYEKAALGGAAVIALGVGALILTSDAGTVTEEQDPVRVNTFEVPEKEALAFYEKALEKKGIAIYQKHLESDLYSFIPFPIYGVKGEKDLKELAPETILNGAPLSWWKKYELTDYQFEGGGKKDSDKDGFSHKEEYDADTSPIDLASHPDLIKKLQLIESKKTPYRIQWSRVDNERANMTFTLRNTSFDICGVGDTFPTSRQPKEFLNRFKVKAKGTGRNPTTNSEEEFYDVEDTQKGTLYKMWRSDAPMPLLDWSSTFKLNTPDGGDKFTVPEGGEFSLPYIEGGKGYKFKLDPERDPKLNALENIQIESKNGVVPLGLAPIQPENKVQPNGEQKPNDLFNL